MARAFTLIPHRPDRARARRTAASLCAALTVMAAAPGLAFGQVMVRVQGERADELQPYLSAVLEEAGLADPAPDGAVRSPAVNRTLLAALRSRGYYGARVVQDREDAGLVYRVAPGALFTIAAVNVALAPPDEAARLIALNAADLEPGAPLSAEAVIAGEARALAGLQEAGWPDADRLERSVTVDHAEAAGEIVFNFAAGRYSEYGPVRAEDTRWRARFIERLATFETGEPVSLSALSAYRARLSALSGVAEAEIRLAEPETGEVERAVLVALTPAPRHVVEAGFSLSTSEGGGVDGALTRRNLFGGAEALTVSAQLSTLEQSVGVSVTAPYWRRLDQSLTVLATVRNEETDAFDQLEAQAEIDITRAVNEAWSVGAMLGVDASSVTVDDAREDTVSLRVGGSAVFDTRNSPTDPSAGLRASLDLSPVLTLGDIRSGYLVNDAELRSYRRIGRAWTAAGRVRLGTMLGASLASVPADERFYAGGGGSVRGYEFQALGPRSDAGRPSGGRSVIEASAELRWRSEGRWGAAVFADAGAASEQTTPDFSGLRVGLGAGLRYHFDFAPLRIDIAAPVDRRSDEASVHLYVGLGQAF